MTTRRQFLNTAAVASGSALIAQSALPDLAWGATPSPMNILILGGTGYIGPHLVRLAVSRGHKVTTFTRGRRKPELPPGVIQLIGDRNGQLQALEGKMGDADRRVLPVPQAWSGRDHDAAHHSGGSEGRVRELRRAEGAMRRDRARGLRQRKHRGASQLHCRAGRYQRPFSLLAAATREGRRDPGAGKEVRSGADGRPP
jgi:NAD dependent epimerase/dehydratase family